MALNKFLELLGWYGTLAIISAYFLNSFNIIHSTDITYQLLNLTGGIGIVLISLKKRAYQPAVLNIVWSLIALIAIIKII